MKKNRLKRKLQIRFVLLALLTLFVLLSAILGASAVFGWRDQARKADLILEEIRRKPDSGARYFSVVQIGEKGVFRVQTSQHLSLGEDAMLKLAGEALQGGKKEGFLQNFRYRVYEKDGAVRVLFLSRAASLEIFYSSLRLQAFVSLGGLGVMALILTVFSGIVVKPITDNHKKQKEFITAASHELRTPLTVIQADAQILEAETGENEWLTDIQKQTARMTRMTEDLVILARSEEIALERKDQIVPLSDVLSELLESYRAPFTRRQRRLETDLQEDLSLPGDEKALREMIVTLFDNAEKYTPDGGVIRISLQKKHREIRLSVENTAKGLSSDEIERLSDRFYRAKNSEGKSGFGLGLSIVSAVCARHRGALKITLPQPDLFSAVCLFR